MLCFLEPMDCQRCTNRVLLFVSLGLFFSIELSALVQEVYTEAFFLAEVTSDVIVLSNSAAELSATVHCTACTSSRAGISSSVQCRHKIYCTSAGSTVETNTDVY